jgi:hypothetical protein
MAKGFGRCAAFAVAADQAAVAAVQSSYNPVPAGENLPPAREAAVFVAAP